MRAWEALAESCAPWAPRRASRSACPKQESQRGKFNMSVCLGLSDPLHPGAGPHTPMTSCSQAMFPHRISPTPQGRRSNAANDP